jgi:hydrogenase nickel incorporation protein HypA/HybF
MHEAAIAESVLRTALSALPRPEMKIAKIVVRAGAMCGVEELPLSTWLEHMAKGTPAEGARLDFQRAAAPLSCSRCDYRGEYDGASPLETACPRCGGALRLERDAGGRSVATDFYVESLEAIEP